MPKRTDHQSFKARFGLHLRSILGVISYECSSSLLGVFLDRLLEGLGLVLGAISLYFGVPKFTTFPDFAKNARPYENAVNSSQIEGPAPHKTIKSPP